MGNFGNLHLAVGRLEQAEDCLRQALKLHHEVGNQHFEGVHSCDYSRCLLALHRTAEAEQHRRLGLSILRQLGDTAVVERKIAEVRESCSKAGIPPFDES